MKYIYTHRELPRLEQQAGRGAPQAGRQEPESRRQAEEAEQVEVASRGQEPWSGMQAGLGVQIWQVGAGRKEARNPRAHR